MKTVVGIRFKSSSKVYYFDPLEFEVKQGDCVIVETSRGVEYGEAATPIHEVTDQQVVPPLKPLLRMATEADKNAIRVNEEKEPEATRVFEEKVAEHNLVMKLVNVEFAFMGGKVTFYFTADGRVDFRELVKDLASVFKIRIELRQIGVRDEAKLLGGIGACGRVVCCHAFMGEFHPVSIKMAKEQGLSLSPTKISGLCGRLMCCLKYEEDCYEQTRKLMPVPGCVVQTPDGRGTVASNNVITEKVKCRVHLSDDTFEMRDYALDQVKVLHKPHFEGQGPAESAGEEE